jgi:ribosomal protein S18 acetylase RimI-like enzyme
MSSAEWSLPGYRLHPGSGLHRALLVKFMQRTYAEFSPQGDFSHIAQTVDFYLSKETPLWWVEVDCPSNHDVPSLLPSPKPVACLWLGNSIDQVQGDRHTHIFLLYVIPEKRRQGIGTALVRYAESWARARGDRKLGLQVFLANQTALKLYRKLGFQTQSLLMTKSLI